MAKKTNPEEDRIFKPPESPHFQTAADTCQRVAEGMNTKGNEVNEEGTNRGIRGIRGRDEHGIMDCRTTLSPPPGGGAFDHCNRDNLHLTEGFSLLIIARTSSETMIER
jgi:hypothetical protein